MENNKYIKITLKKPFVLNIIDLYLSPVKNINYNEYSYQIYEYKKEIDNQIYKFKASFRDNYLLILLDIYHKELDISIYHKDIILINLEWELNKKNINIIKISKNEINNKNYILIPLRKELINNNTFSIDELLNIKDYNKYECRIKNTNNIDNGLSYFYNIFSNTV